MSEHLSSKGGLRREITHRRGNQMRSKMCKGRTVWMLARRRLTWLVL